MKALKISVVATIAATLAWWLHLPHKVWPEHPQFTSFLFALALCIVLQLVWPHGDQKSKTRTDQAEKTLRK